MFGQAFVVVVVVEAAAAHNPGQGALDDQAAGQRLEAALALPLAHHLHRDAQDLAGPGDQPAGVAGVGSHQHHRGHGEAQPVQDEPPAVAVLHASGGDQHHQQQPEGVGDHVPLALTCLPAS